MYAILKAINGNFTVDSEFSELQPAKVMFHGVCQTLWNSADVLTAEVAIVDEQLDCVEGYKEFIHHEAVETAEKVEE